MAVRGSNSLPRGFMGLQVNLVQHAATQVGTVTINPRWNDSTADSFSFSNSGDYAPAAAAGGNAYYDLELPMFTHSVDWYTHTHDTNVGRRDGGSTAISDLNRVSIWAQLGIGDSPHPGYNYSYTHLAILKNHPGAYHQFQTTGVPTPNYAEPRTLRDGDLSFANFRVSGQYYAGGAYGGWYCLANYISNICNTATAIRIINLGGNSDSRSRLRIIDLVFIIHGQLGNTGF